MGGQVKKGKIQAYIVDEVLEKFKAESEKTKLTESKLIEEILAERYGLLELVSKSVADRTKSFVELWDRFDLLASAYIALETDVNSKLANDSASKSAANPELEDRLKYLENKLIEVIGVYEQTSAYLDSRVRKLEGDFKEDLETFGRNVQDDLESLNNLCKFSFESAFNRIGRLERGKRVNDLGLSESANDLQAESAVSEMSLNQVADFIGLDYKRLIKTRKEKGDRFLEYLQQKSGKVWEFDPKADRHGKYRIVEK